MLDFFNSVWWWLTDGIYQFAVAAFSELVQWLTAAWFRGMLWGLEFGWDVAQQLLVDLNITATIQSAFSSLDSDTQSLLGVLRVPEIINAFLSAVGTRWVLRFIPGMGR